jgi:hypothetical protein
MIYPADDWRDSMIGADSVNYLISAHPRRSRSVSLPRRRRADFIAIAVPLAPQIHNLYVVQQ